MQKKTKVSVPDVPPRTYIDRYKNKFKRPTVKYIFVTKVSESTKEFRRKGMTVSSRHYGIGVLTTMNQYYFSEYFTRSTVLTKQVIYDMKRIFLTRYMYTNEVKILVEDKIDRYNEPITQFLGLITTLYGIHMTQVGFTQMLLRINQRYLCVSKKKTYKRKVTKYHSMKILLNLYKRRSFEFITDPMWYERTRYRTLSNIAQIHCAVGILCCFLRDKSIRYNRASKENKKRRMLEEIARKELEKEENNKTLLVN